MGHHYVPRYYLRGFCQNFEDSIWVYDRQESRKFKANIRKIANERKFYSNSLENTLSLEVENPANYILDKVRSRIPLSEEDRKILSDYIVILWKRVPKAKDRLFSKLPDISKEILERFRSSCLLEEQKYKAEEILLKYKKDRPEDIWFRSILLPSTSPGSETLSRMTWRFFTFDKRPAFLTSDSPVFFFKDEGIGNTGLCHRFGHLWPSPG
jgi:hypothetical protein